jgi:hypothetical protein
MKTRRVKKWQQLIVSKVPEQSYGKRLTVVM